MATIKKQYIPLEHVARLNFGIHVLPVEAGKVAYLQARQFDETGRFTEGLQYFLPEELHNDAHLLKDGDVLFTGKGNRHFGWCYHDGFGPAVASSMFFVIRPDRRVIQPEYLTIILNLPENQIHFRQLAGGTNIASIRKSELGAFMIPVIPKSEQDKVVEFNNYHLREIALEEQLIMQKRNLYKATISKIINSTHAKKINAKGDQ